MAAPSVASEGTTKPASPHNEAAALMPRKTSDFLSPLAQRVLQLGSSKPVRPGSRGRFTAEVRRPLSLWLHQDRFVEAASVSQALRRDGPLPLAPPGSIRRIVPAPQYRFILIAQENIHSMRQQTNRLPGGYRDRAEEVHKRPQQNATEHGP
jgi:hypothetical protein